MNPVFLGNLVFFQQWVDGRLMSSKEMPMEEAPWVDGLSHQVVNSGSEMVKRRMRRRKRHRCIEGNQPTKTGPFLWNVSSPGTLNFCGKNVSLIFERLKSYRVAWSLLVSKAVSKPTSSYRQVDWAWREKVPKPIVAWTWRENSPFWNRGKISKPWRNWCQKVSKASV